METINEPNNLSSIKHTDQQKISPEKGQLGDHAVSLLKESPEDISSLSNKVLPSIDLSIEDSKDSKDLSPFETVKQLLSDTQIKKLSLDKKKTLLTQLISFQETLTNSPIKATLEQSIKTLQQSIEEEIKATSPEPPKKTALQTTIEAIFSSKDCSLLLASLSKEQKIALVINGNSFSLSSAGKNSFIIEKEPLSASDKRETIQITLSDTGEIAVLHLDGEELSEASLSIDTEKHLKEWEPLFTAFVKTCQEKASSYAVTIDDEMSGVSISVVQSGVRRDAQYHLEKLTSTMRTARTTYPEHIISFLQTVLSISENVVFLARTYPYPRAVQRNAPEIRETAQKLLEQIARLPEDTPLEIREEFDKLQSLLTEVLSDFREDGERYAQLIASSRENNPIRAEKLAKLGKVFEIVQQIHRFSNPIEKIRLTVTFLNDDLQKNVGQDAGGLSRNYIDDLFQGIVEDTTLAFTSLHAHSTQVLPVAKEPLREEQRTYCEQLGQLMIWCYFSASDQKPFVTGARFDPALLETARSLTPEEINCPFEALSESSKLKMIRVMMEKKLPEDTHLKFSLQLLSFLQAFSAKPMGEISGETLSSFILNIYACDSDIFGENVDIEDLCLKAKEDPQQFIKTHKEQMEQAAEIAKKVVLSGFNGKVTSFLEPIHAIAKGMYSFHPITTTSAQEWWKTVQEDPQFDTKIQGTLDPLMAANSITLAEASNTPEMQQKIDWLKEWLQEASLEDVSAFLKWATGSSSIPKGGIIIEKKVIPSHLPTAHSCFSKVDISPGRNTPDGYEYDDGTKEGFIASIQRSIKESAGTFSMA